MFELLGWFVLVVFAAIVMVFGFGNARFVWLISGNKTQTLACSAIGFVGVAAIGWLWHTKPFTILLGG